MMLPELDLRAIVEQAPVAELPALGGKLREAELLVEVRLRNIVPANGNEPEVEAVRLSPEAAIAAIGGGVSAKWLYRHTKGLRFRSGSRKVIRFEQAGLLKWWAARR
jgi:hypothetical protein